MSQTIPYREASATYRRVLGVRTSGCGYFLAIQGVFIAAWIAAEDVKTCRLLSGISIVVAIAFFFMVLRWESICMRMLESAAALEDLETQDLEKDVWSLHPLKARFEKSKKHGIVKIDFLLPILLGLFSIIALILPESTILKKGGKPHSQVSTLQLREEFQALRSEINTILRQVESQQIRLIEQRVDKIEQKLKELEKLGEREKLGNI